MSEENLSPEYDRAKREAELDLLEPIDFDTMEQQIKKWILIADPGVLKFLAAAYVANRLPSKAVWVFLVGPSGGGKTEILNCLNDLPDIFSISSLTPNTFLSGFPGKQDASLLPKLTGKTMVFKDWTTILSMNKDARFEIMGQLREIWDGYMSKTFGTGAIRTWEGKVGLIAGSTEAVDMAQQQSTTLGERFIFYRIIMPDRSEVALRSLENDENTELMSRELRNAFFAFVKGIDMSVQIPSNDPEYIKELIRLTDFITKARSGVIRDFGFKKEVIFVPQAEMPTRVTKQLNALSKALMIINKGPLTDRDRHIIYKAALDSIPGTNKMALLQLARRQNQTTAEIATGLGYPTTTMHLYLENLAMLKVVRRQRGGETEEGGNADRWSMSEDYVEILKTYENVQVEPVAPPITPEVQNVLDSFGGTIIEE